jgi:4-hydroxythreonine-4-phosphate dehydrogenase|tara:strand:+ start:14486 stop:15478 length:993 start_codon:yes stop_codon:yes gene_type:complete
MLLSKSESNPIVAITPGEPAGIGPDICLSLVPEAYEATLIVIADPELMVERARLLKVNCPLNVITQASGAQANKLNLMPVTTAVPSIPGQLNSDNAGYVLNTLEIAVNGCLEKRFDAMVTGPVQKSIINDAGYPFSGHTEWLAKKTQTDRVVMMLATSKLRVALATTHLPLRDVADAIEQSSLLETIEILNHDMINKFQLDQPRILVCGLNPHAGEQGHLGREEIDVIEPVIQMAKSRGINVIGPIPADTAFTPAMLSNTDVVLAMYHDQGLPVLKHQGFGDAVNVTLGLPIVRTSVDHGTALDLAATGKADASSLDTAIRIAINMCQSS